MLGQQAPQPATCRSGTCPPLLCKPCACVAESGGVCRCFRPCPQFTGSTNVGKTIMSGACSLGSVAAALWLPTFLVLTTLKGSATAHRLGCDTELSITAGAGPSPLQAPPRTSSPSPWSW